MQHALNWFEIPLYRLRPCGRILHDPPGIELKVMEMNGRRGMFPVDEQGVGGCVSNDSRKPSADGSIVYLNARDQLDAMLARSRRPAAPSSCRARTSRRTDSSPSSKIRKGTTWGCTRWCRKNQEDCSFRVLSSFSSKHEGSLEALFKGFKGSFTEMLSYPLPTLLLAYRAFLGREVALW